MKKIEKIAPREARALIRKGEWQKSTASLALGYAQANLVILPNRYAFDFLLFCQRNPKPCPLLEVLETGKYITEFLAAGADITTDLPLYNIYRNGKLTDTVPNIEDLWQEDFVTFLLGCSHSFEEALLKMKIPIRHIEEDKTVPMYITGIQGWSRSFRQSPTVFKWFAAFIHTASFILGNLSQYTSSGVLSESP